MKVLLTATFLLFVIVTDAYLRTRFRSLKCVSLNETVVFHNCYLKPYSRNYSSMNIAFTHHLAFDKPFTMNLIVKYRYGTIFREVYHTTVDWCDLLKGIESNPVAKLVSGLLKDSVPMHFKGCPFKPALCDLKNLTFNDDNWISPIPQGLYRLELTFLNAFSLAINSEAWSDIKSSF